MKKRTSITRRKFISKAATGMAFTIIPRYVLGAPGNPAPSEKLNLAHVGAGGQALADIRGLRKHTNTYAIADVDWNRGAQGFQEHPQAKKYKDFRKMLDEIGDKVDAVVVSTPDHTHTIAALDAMRRNKHVYCQKPLAHSIFEVRQLQKTAQKHGVITQLGNQGHSFNDIRSFCEWIWDGAIGQVHTVHTFCNSNYSRINNLKQLQQSQPVPDTLDWDLWQGPVQKRPYHSMFLPGSWRGWIPYGCGVIGDWVCHVVDPAFWALDLDAPTSIKAEAANYDPDKHRMTFPPGCRIEYQFPAKGNRPPVKLVWFDGETRPPRPTELEENRKVVDIGGVVYGDKGTIMYGSHGAGGVQILPYAKMKAYRKPTPTLERVPGDHYVDWLNAIKANRPAGSNFNYGGKLTEIALLGIIALRFPGQTLQWNTQAMAFTNYTQAHTYLHPEYHNGWNLELT